MTLRIPKHPFPTNWKEYFSKVLKQSLQAVRAEISYEMNDKSILMERSAVEAMDSLGQHYLAYTWWNFLTRFDEFPDSARVNLLTWFLALQTQLDVGLQLKISRLTTLFAD